MKLKQSKTKKTNAKSSKISKEIVVKTLGAEIIECDNCHNLNGKHAKHCYKGSKNIANVICGPDNSNLFVPKLGLNWDLSVLRSKILSILNDKMIPEFKIYYDNLFGYLHGIIQLNNIDLPEPTIELIDNEINLSWFSQTAQMALTFSIAQENNKFILHMSYLCDNKATDIYNPSNEEILEKLKAFQMWKHIMEIRNIISETDPNKFPNTISDKKLYPEEKLEFIGEILSELRMDFTDAEHQIDYHSDGLADNFRTTMNALNKIHCITCLSVEEIDDMENGKV